jgi:hypothetical protein
VSVRRFRDFLATPAARRLGKGLKYGSLAAIVTLIGFQLTRIGWADLFANLPVSPWFYALFLAQLAVVPVHETLAYGALWRRNLWPHHFVLWRKRVLNLAVADASGEAYFGFWASRRLGAPLSETAKTVKDVALTIVLAGLGLTAALAAALWLSGAYARAGVSAAIYQPLTYASVAFFAAACGVGVFARGIFHVSRNVFFVLMASNLARMALIALVTCAQWAIAVPGGAAEVWIVFFSLLFALQRVPVLPGKQVLFVGASVFLAEALNEPPEVVAGMLVMWAALPLVANALVYALTMQLDFEPAQKPAE